VFVEESKDVLHKSLDDIVTFVSEVPENLNNSEPGRSLPHPIPLKTNVTSFNVTVDLLYSNPIMYFVG
jgi:hypothetical protein